MLRGRACSRRDSKGNDPMAQSKAANCKFYEDANGTQFEKGLSKTHGFESKRIAKGHRSKGPVQARKL